jgi:FtsZ-binding cell division protein ZapB
LISAPVVYAAGVFAFLLVVNNYLTQGAQQYPFKMEDSKMNMPDVGKLGKQALDMFTKPQQAMKQLEQLELNVTDLQQEGSRLRQEVSWLRQDLEELRKSIAPMGTNRALGGI